MDSSMYRGLVFLLSLGTLPTACKTESGETDGGAGTTGGTTGAATDPTETGGGPQGCAALVDYRVRCDASLADKEAELVAECEAAREQTEAVDGAACAERYDAYHGCLYAAACDELSPCSDEGAAATYCFPQAGALCLEYGVRLEECGIANVDIAVGECQHAINLGTYQDGAACGSVVEDYWACLSTQPCVELETMQGCDAEWAALMAACPTNW